MSKLQGWSQSVVCSAADTEYRLPIRDGFTQLQIRHRDLTKSWRWSFQPGVVAGGGGTPMDQGEDQRWTATPECPIGETTIYLATDAADAFIEASGLVIVP